MMIIQIAGRLGKDAETRFTNSGQKVTSFNVATNVRKAGKDETVWWRVTIWGDRFDKMMPYLKKGSAVIVVGEMQKPEIWTDKEGRPQVNLELTAEIIRFSPFGNPDRPQEQQNQSNPNMASAQNQSAYGAAPANTAGGDFGFDNFNAPSSHGTQGQQGSGAARYTQLADETIPF